MAENIKDKANIIEDKIYGKILSGSIDKLNILCVDKPLKDAIFLALEKTLNKIKEGKLSPAIFPVILEQDLQLDQQDLAIELSIICAYFHTAADLADDVEDESKNNPVINKYGKAQAVNISHKLIFIYQELITRLKIEPKNKLELISFFSKSGNQMVSGQFYDLALTNRPDLAFDDKNIDLEHIINISKNKSGTELGCFMACLLVALGKPADLYYDLGILYGSLIQIFSDYFDIWGELQSDDLICLKNSLPIFLACNDPKFSNEIRVLLAGKNDSINNQFKIRRLLSKTRVIENFKEYIERCDAGISRLTDILLPLERFSSIIQELLVNCEVLINALYELREASEEDSFSDLVKLDNSINMANNYIKSDPTFQDVWEIQRWGFLNEPNLIGNIFSPALVLETLLETDFNISSNLKDLMSLKGDKGWHYYSNTNKIPTDSDDLGQLLNLVGRTNNVDKYQHLFDEPLQILKNNIEASGKCPTWLSDGVNHHKEDIEVTWYGNECLGVMANLYYGLYMFDKEKYMPIILKGIDYIVDNLPSEKDSYAQGSYYTYYYMFYLVSRLVNALGLEFTPLNRIKMQLIREQLLDGSWNNSSQDTAFVLLGLMTFTNIDHLIIKTSAKYLSDTQNFDGSWYGEDLFICPGKDNKSVYYKNNKVTTAFGLRALIKVTKYLKTEQKTNKKFSTSNSVIENRKIDTEVKDIYLSDSREEAFK